MSTPKRYIYLSRGIDKGCWPKQCRTYGALNLSPPFWLLLIFWNKSLAKVDSNANLGWIISKSESDFMWAMGYWKRREDMPLDQNDQSEPDDLSPPLHQPAPPPLHAAPPTVSLSSKSNFCFPCPPFQPLTSLSQLETLAKTIQCCGHVKSLNALHRYSMYLIGRDKLLSWKIHRVEIEGGD